jgi:hypothetical protein
LHPRSPSLRSIRNRQQIHDNTELLQSSGAVHLCTAEWKTAVDERDERKGQNRKWAIKTPAPAAPPIRKATLTESTTLSYVIVSMRSAGGKSTRARRPSRQRPRCCPAVERNSKYTKLAKLRHDNASVISTDNRVGLPVSDAPRVFPTRSCVTKAQPGDVFLDVVVQRQTKQIPCRRGHTGLISMPRICYRGFRCIGAPIRRRWARSH